MDNLTLQKIKAFAEKEMSGNPDPGHNMSHVDRVHNLALKIAESETGVDLEVLHIAALLHDIGGQKEMDDPSGQTDHAVVSAEMAKPILDELGFSAEKISHIQACIISHRYKTDNRPASIEAKILFDADKLDAVGAIGIARAFCWVGKKNAHIYKTANIDEYIKENMNGKINGRIQDKTKHSPQIEYEVKSKFLVDKLFTVTAKKIGQDRLAYFKTFLDRLEREISGLQ